MALALPLLAHDHHCVPANPSKQPVSKATTNDARNCVEGVGAVADDIAAITERGADGTMTMTLSFPSRAAAGDAGTPPQPAVDERGAGGERTFCNITDRKFDASSFRVNERGRGQGGSVAMSTPASAAAVVAERSAESDILGAESTPPNVSSLAEKVNDGAVEEDACVKLCKNGSAGNVDHDGDVKRMATSEGSLLNISDPMHDEFTFRMDEERSTGGNAKGMQIMANDNDDVESRAGHGDNESTEAIRLPMSNTDANTKHEHNGGCAGKPPPAAKSRSVHFAPLNKSMTFNGEWAVSTIRRGQESDVELHDRTTAGKVARKRKRARFMTRAGFSGAVAKRANRGPPPSPTFPVYAASAGATSTRHQTTKRQIKVALLHSESHTQILHRAMKYIHKDRDILLESLLKWCGIFHGAKPGGALASFLAVVPPKMGTRMLLERFHGADYLDLLQFPPSEDDSIEENVDATTNECSASAKSSNSMCNSPIDETDSASYEQYDVGWAGSSSDSSDEEITEEETYMQLPSDEILSKYGLEDDCPFPASRQRHALLWKYCLAVSGASWHAASLLTDNVSKDQTDVAIHWGGGRHHSHPSKAGGFCYVSDVVLAIQRLQLGQYPHADAGMLEGETPGNIPVQKSISFRRILYVDIDIHHADAVQGAFYSTDKVLTASLHRHSPGFFPANSGALGEKGEAGTSGLGYNLNLPLPAGISDVQFIAIYRKALFGLVKAYDPHAIVLCVGADGLEGDELVSGGIDSDQGSGEGWNLSPEGLAECVRLAAALCAGSTEDETCRPPAKEKEETKIPAIDEPQRRRRKLLVLGGGGYTPAETARTHLLSSAAACEGARPGMLWSQLPSDIPQGDPYFPRYINSMFELVSEEKKTEIFSSYSSPNTEPSPNVDNCDVDNIDAPRELSDSDKQVLQEANRAIDLSALYIERQREKKIPITSNFCYDAALEGDDEILLDVSSQRKKGARPRGGGRRKKKKVVNGDASQTGAASS